MLVCVVCKSCIHTPIINYLIYIISISIVYDVTYGQMRINNNSNGFTVVEVVVAFVLFSMVAMMLVSITEYVQYSQRQSIYTNIAKNAAQSKISEYQSREYGSIGNGDTDDFSDEPELEGLPEGSSATIEVSQPTLSESSKELEVTVTYPAASTTKTIKMKAYVTEGETT